MGNPKILPCLFCEAAALSASSSPSPSNAPKLFNIYPNTAYLANFQGLTTAVSASIGITL